MKHSLLAFRRRDIVFRPQVCVPVRDGLCACNAVRWLNNEHCAIPVTRVASITPRFERYHSLFSDSSDTGKTGGNDFPLAGNTAKPFTVFERETSSYRAVDNSRFYEGKCPSKPSAGFYDREFTVCKSSIDET